MNALRINSLSNDIFSYKANDNSEKTIKVCGADGNTRVLDRERIVTGCRMATVEYYGRLANADKENSLPYKSRVNNYGDFQKSVWEETVLYCAAIAQKSIGREPYGSMKEVEADRKLYKNSTFWTALSYISEEVITPLWSKVIPDGTDRLVSWRNGRLGETQLIDIESNDFFVFDDDSWGSVSSKPYQYLYKAQIALTPKPYTAVAKIKWYQDIIGGEAGRYFAAFMRGAASKMYGIMIERFKKAIANTKYLPAGLIFDSFSTDNWNKAIMMSSALNGVDRKNITAIGTLPALNKVLLGAGSPSLIAGIQGMVGDEWVRNGFLANVSGVNLIELGLGVVPHTQNYDPKFVSLDDATSENVYLLANTGYQPMVGVIADGSPIDITFTPRETADMTIDIAQTLVFDIAPAFSQKIIKIAM